MRISVYTLLYFDGIRPSKVSYTDNSNMPPITGMNFDFIINFGERPHPIKYLLSHASSPSISAEYSSLIFCIGILWHPILTYPGLISWMV